MTYTPEGPSIRKMSHFINSPDELRNCPVKNWEIYLKRRLDEDRRDNGKLNKFVENNINMEVPA